MSGKGSSPDSREARDYDRKRGPRKSTGGEAPRKMLCPKGRKYFYQKKDGKVQEIQTQTYASTSAQQTQAVADQKNVSSQTDFNSRFYIERTDRLAQETLARQNKCGCQCQCGAMDETDSD